MNSCSDRISTFGFCTKSSPPVVSSAVESLASAAPASASPASAPAAPRSALQRRKDVGPLREDGGETAEIVVDLPLRRRSERGIGGKGGNDIVEPLAAGGEERIAFAEA